MTPHTVCTHPHSQPPQVFATELVQDSPMSGVTTVTLTIINENDNTPDFRNESYTARVPENSNPGEFVTMVSV